ncbi:MAG: M48 family metallopeptidase, partial [Desulfobacterales bacterium]
MKMIPFNIYLSAYIAIYVTSFALSVFIDWLNVKYLEKHGRKVPAAFEGMIDAGELKKISQYTTDNIRFKRVESGMGKMFFLFIILSGILPWLAEAVNQQHFLLAGLLFFSVPGLVEAIASLPFDYYHSFVLEEKYGFNTKTLTIWLADIIKSFLIMIVLGAFLLSALLLMLKYAGPSWWIWAWIVLLMFQLLMTILYPTVIAPIFNTFTPVKDGDLKTGIEKLAKGEGINVAGIYQMDATRRTRHTNAYLAGLGKAKRIVLFDSLIQGHDHEEILAILAHEIGHLKKNHIKKQLAVVSLVSLLLFYLASKLLVWDVMYTTFGFSIMPQYVGLFLVGILWGPLSFFLSPIGMALSRKYEREADDYSQRALKTAKPLSKALKKMARENLSNLTPHPLYVCFN